jgi:hypothetical protein
MYDFPLHVVSPCYRSGEFVDSPVHDRVEMIPYFFFRPVPPLNQKQSPDHVIAEALPDLLGGNTSDDCIINTTILV